MKLTVEELKIKNERLSEKELDNVNGGYIVPFPILKEIGRWVVKKLNLQKTIPQQTIPQQVTTQQ